MSSGTAPLLRSLRRSPGYALGVVLTLGIGVGVTAASLSVVRAVFFAPLPHANGDRLVYLRQAAPGGGVDNALFSVPEIRTLREGVPSFLDVAEFSAMRFTALGLDRPREVRAGVVDGGYFGVLGLDALHGRVIGPADDGDGAAPVVVLTAPFWRRLYGGDPGVVGRTIEIGGRTATVVGVAEPHPPYPEHTDVYVNLATSPHHLSATMNHDWTHRMTEAFARLAPGATLQRAQGEVESVTARMRSDHPEAYDERLAHTVSARTLADQLSRRVRPVLGIVLGTAAAVLLVALANVAHLVLTRAHALRGELAVRAALGASPAALRGRIRRETVLLGVAGGAVGLGVCAVFLRLLAGYASRFTVRASEIHFGPWAVLLPLLLAVASMVALAELPRLPRGGPVRNAAGTGGSDSGRASAQTRRALIVGQVAASLILVTSAALLARTVANLQSVDAGMETAEVVAVDVPPVHDGRTPAEIRDDQLEVVRALEARPEVERAAITNVVPFRLSASILPLVFDFRLDGTVSPAGVAPYRAGFRTVSSGYFETLGIPVREGRVPTPADDAEAPLVAVVNEAFVRAFADGRSPLGRRVAWTGDVVRFAGVSGADRTIVGVVADATEESPTADPSPAVYVPHRQEAWGSALVVRGQGGRMAALPEVVVEAVRSVLPNQPVENATTLEEARRATFGDSTLNASLVGALALVSILVAGAGLFAALSFSVSRRKRELGVRKALGADRRHILFVVLAEALGVTAAGLVVGAVGSRLASDTLEGLLHGVEPGDPAALLTAALVLLGVAAVASLLPALRAARVDPAQTLAEG